MTTRRTINAKQVATSEAVERRSLGLGTSKQSSKDAKAAKTTSTQKQKDIVPPSTGDQFDDANISDDEEGGTRVGDIYIPPPVQPHCSAESKGPRLIIVKIENNNFKSYAGKVFLGPFHHCFTAIIGPNGSGKSNVIDSMLFVFGYRANKIRCKKISTLLHNSAKFPNINMCSVAVHFRQIVDKEDGTCEEVPDSDIIVERTAFRDNSSFYTINGKRVQFKEVSKLLKKHYVDLDHNRFLILQGEVESIAMMKPKGQTESECGMLEYLEDIVGTTRYKEPLVKINVRVEQLTEERTEKHNRCKLAEREMNDMEQPYNEAVEYLRQENENTRTKNLRIQKYLSEKNKKLQQYTKEHDEIMAELEEHKSEADGLRTKREEMEGIIQKEMQNHDNMRKKKEDLEKKLQKANSNFAEVQETMTLLNKRRHQNISQTEQNEKQLEDLRKLPAKNQKEIEECEKKIERLNKQKSDAEEQLQKNYAVLKEQTKSLIEDREKLETELMKLTSNVDEAKAELALSESEMKILKHDETAEARKYETMRSSYDDSELGLKEKQSKVTELKESIPQMINEINEKTQQMQKLQNEEQQLRSQIMTIRGEINERTVSMQAIRSNNKVLDFLMRQKSEGKLPGILGRLGDLGGIDSKYDVAISTSCGRLDNIIVDTVDTAQECIESLKRYDVGRASFIALEKVEHLRSQIGCIQTPENAPRLFDLVHVEDNRVIPAFFFALRNTLVASDLEQGTRIAYGKTRFRVVTLKGDLIETSGTMSGGGRTLIRGKMGTKVRTNTSKSAETSMISQKALEDMQIKAEELQSTMNFNQEEQGRLEREIYELKTNQQRNEAEVQKHLISIRSLEEQLPRIFKQLETQKKRMQETKTDAGKVKEIEASIVAKKKTLKEADRAAGNVNEKITAIKNQINAIHGDKINTVQSKITTLENQIKKLKGNVSKLKVESANNDRNVKKLEQQTERLKADVLKAQDELKRLSEKRQKFDDEVTDLTKEIEEAKEVIEKSKSESSSIHKEITAIQKMESDLKLKRIEIDQKLQTVAAKLSDVKSQIPHWRDQLKPLRLHEIPGDSEPQLPLKVYTEEELATHTLQDIQYKESVQEELLKKKPNLSCISEYIEKRDVYLERVKVLEDITCKRNEMRQLYDDVRKKRYNEFMQGFHIITRKLKEMYQMITQGGDAELELVDSMDPFTEGVSFSVRPPKKTWKNISNLSGGEKTLSSLALVFALHYYKPSPLYFMDEIDAALDFKNISIVAHYIKERTKNAQFIIISLRSNMFELSDYLVGIYKVKDCTDSVCIQNEPPKLALIETQQSQTEIVQSQPAHLHPEHSTAPLQVLADETVSLNESVNPSTHPETSVADHIIASDQQEEEDNENNLPSTSSLACSKLRRSKNVSFAHQEESSGSKFTQPSADGRNSENMSFIPNCESTALSQVLQMNLTRTSNISAQEGTSASFTDQQFKKPLPPASSK